MQVTTKVTFSIADAFLAVPSSPSTIVASYGPLDGPPACLATWIKSSGGLLRKWQSLNCSVCLYQPRTTNSVYLYSFSCSSCWYRFAAAPSTCSRVDSKQVMVDARGHLVNYNNLVSLIYNWSLGGCGARTNGMPAGCRCWAGCSINVRAAGQPCNLAHGACVFVCSMRDQHWLSPRTDEDNTTTIVARLSQCCY